MQLLYKVNLIRVSSLGTSLPPPTPLFCLVLQLYSKWSDTTPPDPWLTTKDCHFPPPFWEPSLYPSKVGNPYNNRRINCLLLLHSLITKDSYRQAAQIAFIPIHVEIFTYSLKKPNFAKYYTLRSNKIRSCFQRSGLVVSSTSQLSKAILTARAKAFSSFISFLTLLLSSDRRKNP